MKENNQETDNNKTNLEDNSSEQNTKIEKSGIIRWITTNKQIVAISVLVLSLISTVVIYQAKLSTLESQFITEKKQYQEQSELNYQIKLDSVNLDNAARLSKVFSWSVRSELLRGNNEQVSILFGQYIKTPGVAKVSLIDPENGEIVLSTDRKLEGEQFKLSSLLQENTGEIVENKLILPISGLNDIIGYLNFEFDNLATSQLK